MVAKDSTHWTSEVIKIEGWTWNFYDINLITVWSLIFIECFLGHCSGYLDLAVRLKLEPTKSFDSQAKDYYRGS